MAAVAAGGVAAFSEKRRRRDNRTLVASQNDTQSMVLGARNALAALAERHPEAAAITRSALEIAQTVAGTHDSIRAIRRNS